MQMKRSTQMALALAGCLALAVVGFLGADAIAAPGDDTKVSPFGISDPDNYVKADDGPSIARSDLYACDELESAVVTSGGSATVEDFAKQFTGTWARELTWHGVSVPTESALYFDMRPGHMVAMAYDQVSLGLGPISRRVDAINNDLALRARTPALTFVVCMKGVRDTYYKISDQFIFEGVNVDVMGSRTPLRSAWDQLLRQGFFDRLNFPTPTGLFDRVGSEVLQPSLVGALWDIELSSVRIGEYDGVRMRMEGIYRGSHWENGVNVPGWEQGDFLMENGSFVSATGFGADDTQDSPTDPTQRGINYRKDVDQRFTIPMDRVVLDPPARR